MPGTTSTTLPSFAHDQHHKTDAAKWKGGGDCWCEIFTIRMTFSHATNSVNGAEARNIATEHQQQTIPKEANSTYHFQ